MLLWQRVMGRNKSRKTKDNCQNSGAAEEGEREVNLYKKRDNVKKHGNKTIKYHRGGK